MDRFTVFRGNEKSRIGISPAVPPRSCSQVSGCNPPTAFAISATNSPFPSRKLKPSVDMPTCLPPSNLTTSQLQPQATVYLNGKSDLPNRQMDKTPTVKADLRRHTLGSPVTGCIHHFPQAPTSGKRQKNPCLWSTQTENTNGSDISRAAYPGVVRARAVLPFHNGNPRHQTLGFDEGEIVGVYIDSMTPREDRHGVPTWWRGFRFSSGPKSTSGFFPSSHVTLMSPHAFSATHGPNSPLIATSPFSATRHPETSNASAQNDNTESYSSISEEEDETGLGEKTSTATHSDNRETLFETEAIISGEIDAFAYPASQAAVDLTRPNNNTSLPVESSNRNSVTSLDSGQGSAYATNSDTSKIISTTYSDHIRNYQSSNSKHHCSQTGRNVRIPIYSPSLASTNRIPPFSGIHATRLPSASSCSSSSTSSGASCGGSGSSCSSSCVGNSSRLQSSFGSHDRTPDELLLNWLATAGFSDYASHIVSAGYDLSTLRRATPEDLNACGVTNPTDRLQLRARLGRLQLPESLPDYVPKSVSEWFSVLNLTAYWPVFQSQDLLTFEKISVLTWEDLEEIGITKLGHQKKLILAIDQLRKALTKRNEDQSDHTGSTANRQPSDCSQPSGEIMPSTEELDFSEANALSDETPPPPPAFQDPPNIERKASLDLSGPYKSLKMTHYRHHFSTGYLADLDLQRATESVGEGSTKSDPLHHGGGVDVVEVEDSSNVLQPPIQVPIGAPLSMRQWHRNSAVMSNPVSVANEMIPLPTNGYKGDKDLQDMQDIRSMLDKLSEHLVPRGSP